MDAAGLVVSVADVERVEENGVHTDHKAYEGDENVAVEVNGRLDLLEISDAPDASAFPEVPPSLVEVDSEECNGSPATPEVGLPKARHETTFKEQTSQGKSKTANPLSSKTSGPNGLKKTSRKEEKVTSNGTSSASSHPKKPNLTSPKPSNEGIVATGIANKIKPVLTSSNVKNVKQVPSINIPQANDTMETEKVKPLKKEAPQEKMEGDQDTARSPTAEDAQAQRVGKLPTYGFSFKCYERAEKRKEFYSKLEEKIHAKEVEINNREAQSKESQEAEIKMLRKSLNFKATPMPNFYQEPIPPKVELKKIPITRPKSPKLGRRKSSSGADDVDVSHNHVKGKLDLAEKICQNKPAKTSTLAHPEKPQRKSLPKLPSQKTALSKSTDKALPSAKNMTNSAAPSTQTEPLAGATEQSELGLSASITEKEEVHLEGGGHTMPANENEPVTAEL